MLLLWIPLRTLLHGTCFLLDYLLFPRLWTQPVERPVFIVGHGRSGTTHIQRILSADGDRFSYFKTWELLFPSVLQHRALDFLDAFGLRAS